MKKYILPLLALSSVALLSGCKNAEHEFSDYEGGTTVYFPYQRPVRTILLGGGVEYDNSLDNAHKFRILGYGAGAYNSYEYTFQYAVDESLVDTYAPAPTSTVRAMPQSYYKISGNTSTYYGNFNSGFEVELTDAFFQDPYSLLSHWVIPIRMSNVTGATRILDSTYAEENDLSPMDYTLYCVKYVNPWEGYYLLKGTAADLLDCTIIRVYTTSLTTCEYRNPDYVTMTLDFGSETSTQCTITGEGVAGTGTFGSGTEAKAWGDKDRDALYLNYTVGSKTYQDTLVLQRRGDFAGTIIEF